MPPQQPPVVERYKKALDAVHKQFVKKIGLAEKAALSSGKQASLTITVSLKARKDGGTVVEVDNRLRVPSDPETFEASWQDGQLSLL